MKNYKTLCRLLEPYKKEIQFEELEKRFESIYLFRVYGLDVDGQGPDDLTSIMARATQEYLEAKNQDNMNFKSKLNSKHNLIKGYLEYNLNFEGADNNVFVRIEKEGNIYYATFVFSLNWPLFFPPESAMEFAENFLKEIR